MNVQFPVGFVFDAGGIGEQVMISTYFLHITSRGYRWFERRYRFDTGTAVPKVYICKGDDVLKALSTSLAI